MKRVSQREETRLGWRERGLREKKSREVRERERGRERERVIMFEKEKEKK